jgi:hypothetical protein
MIKKIQLPETLRLSAAFFKRLSKSEKAKILKAPSSFILESTCFRTENHWENPTFFKKILAVQVVFEDLLNLPQEWIANIQKTKLQMVRIDLSSPFFFTHKAQTYFKENAVQNANQRLFEAVTALLNSLQKNNHPLTYVRVEAQPWMKSVNESFQALKSFPGLESLIWNFGCELEENALRIIEQSNVLRSLYKKCQKGICVNPENFLEIFSCFKNLKNLETDVYIQPPLHESFITNLSKLSDLRVLLLGGFFPQKKDFSLMKESFAKLKFLEVLGLSPINHQDDLEIFENWYPENSLRSFYLDGSDDFLKKMADLEEKDLSFQKRILNVISQFPNLEKFPEILELSDQRVPLNVLFPDLSKKKKLTNFYFTVSNYDSIASLTALILDYKNLKDLSLDFIEPEEKDNKKDEIYSHMPCLKSDKKDFSAFAIPFLRRLEYMNKLQNLELSFHHVDFFIIDKLVDSLKLMPDINYLILGCHHETIPEIKYFKNHVATYSFESVNPSKLGQSFGNLYSFLERKGMDYLIKSNKHKLSFEKMNTNQGKFL